MESICETTALNHSNAEISDVFTMVAMGISGMHLDACVQ